jgi:hypothetical protein
VRLRLLAAAACLLSAIAAVATGSARVETPARGGSGIAPRPPGAYALPDGAVHVASARELRAALHLRPARAIVLAPGTYGGARPFLNPHGHRLYSARPGAARLTAGLSLGGGAASRGALVQGLVFDIAHRRRAFDTAAITVWGGSRDARILDIVVRGHGVVGSGIRIRQPVGAVVQRVVARGFRSYGVLVDANDPRRGVLGRPFRLEDVDVSDVSHRRRGASNGRAEACIWVGNTGVVRRVRARSCGLTGLWTGTAAKRALFDGIDVDGATTGVYLEHFTHHSTFRRLRIGPGVRVGLNAEWADPDWSRRPASVGNVVEHGEFESSFAGVYLDEGTTSTTVRHNRFSGQEWTAIGNYRGVGNAHYGNVVGPLAPGAQAYREEHPSSFPGGR